MAIYYVDATTGDDSDTGLTEALAWATISKVNAASFSAGDSILFKKGDTWREQLTVPSSGSAGSVITFGAYGSGAAPIISGADLITTWTAGQAVETGGIFVADAEDGGTADFTGVTTAGSATFAASTASKNNGTYGYEATSDGTNNAYGYKTTSSQSDIYVRAYIKVATGYNTTGTFKHQQIIGLLDSGNNIGIRATIYEQTEGTFYVYVNMPWGGYVGGTSSAISLNTWYRLEIHFKVDGSVGGGQAWLDGVSFLNNLTLNTSGKEVVTVRVGLQSVVDVANSGSKVYFDDIKADTATIGAVNLGDSNVYSADCAWQPYVVTQDSARLTSVASTAAVNAVGKWYYDSSAQKLYVRASDDADPDTHTMEAYRRQFGVYVLGKDYITVDGLAFTGHQPSDLAWSNGNFGAGVGIRIPAATNGIGYTITNCTFEHEGDTAITAHLYYEADPPSGRTASYLTITDNTVDEVGWVSTYHSLSATGRGNWVFGAVTAADDNVWDHVTVTGNTLYDDITLHPTDNDNHARDGIVLALTGGVNLIERNTIAGVSHGINVVGFTNASDVGIIRRNIIHDTSDDFINTGEPFGAVVVAYNVGYNGQDNGIDMFSAVNNADTLRYGFLCYNNVIYNVNNAGLVLRKVNNAVVKNNIFMETGTTNDLGEQNNVIHIKDSDATASNVTLATLVCDYNLWWNPTSGVAVVNKDIDAGQTWPTFAQWQSLGFDVNGVNADPLFVSTVTPDFHLQATSPAIDAGVDVGLITDYTGRLVPIGIAPDIGAYEFGRCRVANLHAIYHRKGKRR